MKKMIHPSGLLILFAALLISALTSALFSQSSPSQPQKSYAPARRILKCEPVQDLIQHNKVLTKKVDGLSLGLAELSAQLRSLKPQESVSPSMTAKVAATPSHPREAAKPKSILSQEEPLDLSSIETKLGEPDAVTSTERNYYKKGVSVRLDPSGYVESVTYHGQHASDIQDVNGNYSGLFQKDGRWYRPQLWTVNGLTVGDSIEDVLGQLGLSDETLADINSQQYLYYRSKKLTVKVSAPPHSRVLGFRLGTKPSNDINGNIGF